MTILKSGQKVQGTEANKTNKDREVKTNEQSTHRSNRVPNSKSEDLDKSIKNSQTKHPLIDEDENDRPATRKSMDKQAGKVPNE